MIPFCYVFGSMNGVFMLEVCFHLRNIMILMS